MTYPPTNFPSLPRPSVGPRLRQVVLGLLLLFFLAVFVMPAAASLVTDLFWFREVRFESVFVTGLEARALLFVAGALLAYAFLYINIRIARRGPAGAPMVFLNRGAAVALNAIVPRLLLIGTAVVAFVFGIAASSQWMTLLTAMKGVAVGQTDPLLGRDIGFYLFQLPGISALLTALVALTVLSLLGVALLYVVLGAVVLRPRRALIEPWAARHVGSLLALLFVLFALQLWFVDSAALLFSNTGPLAGASYADIHAGLPGIRVSMAAALVAIGMIVYGVVQERLAWFTIWAIVVYAAAGIVFRGIVPATEERFVVAPNELARERTYLQQHIAATRRAWQLDSVTSQNLEGDVQLSMADIRANAPTIDNVRLWERDLLRQTFGQLQEIRTYYDFASVSDDRYHVDGRYRQVHISARELNSSSLPTRNFINERLTFTHGMGIAMAPVNQVTSEGLPVLFIKDLPPVSTVSVKVTRPQIYYGQLSNDYVFVGTGQKEFDYPAGEKNVYTNYSGRGGVPVGSSLRRALYAWQFGSWDIMLSSYLGGNARILYRRNIMERVSTALPFLTFDAEPYLVVTDSGMLKWMIDGYTSSGNWPYSQPVRDGTNYMRNSVKIVLDAYDGTIDAYLSDPNDPIIRTYAAIFGPVFKPLSAMPADLRAHLRYPGDLFRLQTGLYARFHMDDPDAFYHREDQWQYPSNEAGVSANGGVATSTTPFMRHIIMRLPGQADPEFIYMTPFTPQGKDNLAAWMAARMDGANYGKLVVYRFPKQSLVYGPKQIANRINEETSISQQVTLWDQKGSQVIRGELLVIPIREALIYVQPLYLRAEGGAIPELKRVVVAQEDRVVMGETLDEALSMLFGGSSPSRATLARTDTGAAVPGGTASNADLLRQAQQYYDRAIAAQRAGDWATYGREIDQLGSIIRQLQPTTKRP